MPNLVVAKVGADGKVAVYNHSGSTHVVVDVVGWFEVDGGAGGASYTALDAVTRSSTPATAPAVSQGGSAPEA